MTSKPRKWTKPVIGISLAALFAAAAAFYVHQDQKAPAPAPVPTPLEQDVDYSDYRAEPDTKLLIHLADNGYAARPLYTVPDFKLPSLPENGAVGVAVIDLTTHPLAGSRVIVTLRGRDAADKTHLSEQIEITLPARQFTSPLTSALMDQRRLLAADANQSASVALALTALVEGEMRASIPDAATQLVLRHAARSLMRAENDDDLRRVVDMLWEVGQHLEKSALDLAAERARDLADELQDQKDNLSDEDLQRKLDELRDALKDMKEKQEESGEQKPEDMPTPEELQEMMDKLEEMKNDPQSLEQLLKDLQEMLNRQQQQDQQQQDQQQQQQQQQEMEEALRELEELIKKQEQLLKDTQDEQKNLDDLQKRDTQDPQAEQESKDKIDDLGEQQKDLQKQLEKLMKDMEDKGLRPPSDQKPSPPQDQNQQGQQSQDPQQGQQQGQQPGDPLDDANKSMGDASNQLGEGDPSSAAQDQSKALDAMRQAAEQMQQQMQQQQQGQQPGNGEKPGGPNDSQFAPTPGERTERMDPLGRPLDPPNHGPGDITPKEPGENKAGDIADKIRDRLSDPNLPQSERDYLQRLLQPQP